MVPSFGAQVPSVQSVISVPKDVRFFESDRWRLVRRDEPVREGKRWMTDPDLPRCREILSTSFLWSSVTLAMLNMLGANLANNGRMAGMEMVMILIVHSKTLHISVSATLTVWSCE